MQKLDLKLAVALFKTLAEYSYQNAKEFCA